MRKKAVMLPFMMLFEQVSGIIKENEDKRSHDKHQPLRTARSRPLYKTKSLNRPVLNRGLKR